MNYKGKLYGRIGNNTYFDTAYTTDDWDAMEAKIKEIEKVKRKPLPDGTLPMTESELKEFKVLFDWQGITKLKFDGIFLHAEMETRYVHSVKNVKAILWLAERFELIKED